MKAKKYDFVPQVWKKNVNLCLRFAKKCLPNNFLISKHTKFVKGVCACSLVKLCSNSI